MKGLVLEDRNKLVWKNDLPEPRIGPHDAVIKPVIVAPCTSDIHIIETMSIPFIRGKTVGHEMAGYIAEVGSKVRDRVAVSASMPNWRTLGVQDGFIKNNDLSIDMNPARAVRRFRGEIPCGRCRSECGAYSRWGFLGAGRYPLGHGDYGL